MTEVAEGDAMGRQEKQTGALLHTLKYYCMDERSGRKSQGLTGWELDQRQELGADEG